MANDELRELEELLRLKKEQIKVERDLNKIKLLQKEEASYERTIKKLKQTLSELDEIGRKQQDIVEGANQFGNAIANLPLGNYLRFSAVSKDISKELAAIQVNIDKVSREINQDFANQKFAIPKPNTKAFKSVISELELKQAGLGKDLQEALMSSDIASFYKKYGEEGRKLAQEAMDKKRGFVGVATYFGKSGQGPKDLQTFQDGMRALEDEARTFQKITLDTSALWSGIRQNILQDMGLNKIIEQVKEFDNRLANLKKEFQIPPGNFKAASEAMADLSIKGAKFGLTTQESFEMVKTIGDEMKSTNIKNLSAIAQSVVAVPAAMGIASSEVAKITGQMMFFGQQSDKVQNAFKNIGKQSAVFGQNATKVAKQFGDAYPKFKMMGMKGNESAIAAMAAQAEKLGINLESSVQSSKNFLDIGEAMESAADLSLLGGAAAQVSYAELMQARLDPKKMIQIQDQITAGLGKFNKATGEIDFGYNDLVQMQEMAKRLGVDYEVLYKRAKGQREDAAKASMFDQNMFKKLNPEEKAFLLSKVVSKGGGKFEIEGFDGITDLKKISNSQVSNQMNAAIQNKKTIEDLAKERASFEETVNRMKGTIMALFNRFQPILQTLTNVLVKVIDVAQGLSNVITKIFGNTVGKYVKASIALGAILMLTMGPSAIARTVGMFAGVFNPKAWFSGFSSLKDKFKDGFSWAGKGATGGNSTPLGGAGGSVSNLGNQKNIFSQLIDGITNILKSGTKLIRTLVTDIGSILQDLIDIIKDTGSNLIDAVSELLGSIINLVKTQGTAIIDAVSSLLGSAIKLIKTQGTALANALGKVGSAIVNNFFKVIEQVFNGLVRISSTLPTILGNVGKAIGSFFQGMTTGLMAFAQAMATPTALFGLPVGLIVVGMAMGLATAARIAAPAINALGPMFTGLGNLIKGFVPVIEATGNAIAKVAGTIGGVVIKVIKTAVDSVMGFSKLNPLQLYGVAGGLGAISLAMAGFGGGSLVAGIGAGIGKFIGGDTVKKLKEFASIDGTNLQKIANGIKAITVVLSSIGSINISMFTEQMKSIGSLDTRGLKKLSEISTVSNQVKNAINSISEISKVLSSVSLVNKNNLIALSITLEFINTKIKTGLNSLATGILSSNIATITIKAIKNIAIGLNSIPNVKSEPIIVLSKILRDYFPSINEGIAKLKNEVVNFQIAKITASGLLSFSNLLNAIPEVKINRFSNLAKILETMMTPISSGLKKMNEMTIIAQVARITANGISKVAHSLNEVPDVKLERFINLSKVLSLMGPLKEGIGKLKSLIINAQVARFAVKGLDSIAIALAAVPFINPTKFTNITKVLSGQIPAISTGLNVLGKTSISTNAARVVVKGITAVTKLMNSVPQINVGVFGNLAYVLEKLVPSIAIGINKLSKIAISSQEGRVVASGISSIANSLGAAASGFTMFAMVPWATISTASKNIKEVMSTLNSVINKVSISPSLSTLTKTFYVLGFAMKSVSNGFSSTTKAMADFNAQSEKLKINTGKAEITTKVSAARAVAEKGVAAGARNSVTVFNPTTPAVTEKIAIAPIEINLKLNGMQIQKLITEANFYRT